MKTKQLKLNGQGGIFHRIRQSKALTDKEPTFKMIDGHKKVGKKLSGRHLTDEHKQHLSEKHADFRGENNGMYGVHRYGEDAPNYGKHQSEEAKQLISDAQIGEKNHMFGKTGELAPMFGRTGEDAPMYGRTGENHPHWNGGRAVAEERRRGFGFIPLNEKFPGSDAHHLDTHFVLYIPKELHQLVYHNVMTGQGMNEINNLAIRCVYGEHEESRW